MEQKNKGRARVRIAVFVVLAIHGIGLLALLMQGCKKEPEAALPADQPETNATPAFVEPTNAVTPEATNVATTTQPSITPPAVDTMPPVTPPPVLPVTATTDYKVAQGDTFSGIAKKFHVPVKAIQDANPGVDATRLKIGQVLHIPPPPAPATSNGTSTPGATVGAPGTKVYTVKSGDNLTSIANQHGVSLKALRSANNLSSDRIKVGQKLTIPAKASAPTAPATNPPATPGSAESTPPTGGVPTGTTPSGQ